MISLMRNGRVIDGSIYVELVKALLQRQIIEVAYV